MRPSILRWYDRLVAQLPRGVDGEVRVAQELAGEEDEVGLVFGDDGVGLFGVRDQANGGYVELGSVFDGFGEADLIARARGNDGVGDAAARAAVNQIDVFALEQRRQL